MRIFQKGFNYSQDGDGNRLVYHLQGCNMACPWCANPEGMRPEGVLVADEDWLLESICPHRAITGTKVERSFCDGCKERECITRHNTKGMYLSYKEESIEEILQESRNNEMMFYDGGGVTFTGGESTVQFEELFQALTGLKKLGIHTAIETNGTHPRLPQLFPVVDQLIMDCKLCNSEKHKRWTGTSNERILENIRKAAAVHPCLHVRVPLIGKVNDSSEDIDGFFDFFKEIKGENVTFEVLAYHEFGKKKWAQCGWEYRMTKEAYVQEEVLLAFRKRVTDIGAHYKRT